MHKTKCEYCYYIRKLQKKVTFASKYFLKTIITMKKLLLVLFIFLFSFVGFSQNSPIKINTNNIKKITKIDIKESITETTSRRVIRSLEAAKTAKSDLVIIDMDTYGGGLYDADAIRKKILSFEKPVWVFINKSALSGGAFIAIACDSIFMSGGASIGAATVVNGDGTYAPEKYQSGMRGEMRATAEKRGRNPQIAEAMVDQTLELDSIKEPGKVLTLTTREAIKLKYCEGELNSIEEILKKYKITDYKITSNEDSFVDKIVDFFLNPTVSFVLLIIIMGGLYLEMQAPGVGLPIAVSVLALVLYFIPYYLAGLAQNWELLLFLVGLILLTVEIFIIPGFGVVGVAGLVFSFGALALMMLNNDGLDFSGIPAKKMLISFSISVFGMLTSVILGIILMPRMLNSKAFQDISLMKTMDSKNGYSVNNGEVMTGKIGFTHTVLRPSGKILIDNILYDASSLGDFIEKDSKIVVIAQETNTLKVKLQD